jgi:hypothetical protein
VSFLQRLKDALQKNINVEQDHRRRITQSALDIHRKLQKLATEGNRGLDQMVWMATSVFYNGT